MRHASNFVIRYVVDHINNNTVIAYVFDGNVWFSYIDYNNGSCQVHAHVIVFIIRL